MGSPNSNLITVFPISTSAFGLRADWFSVYAPKLIHPALLLMTLLLVIAIGVMALTRFENADFEKKAWNIPVVLAVVLIWPSLVIGLKDLVDTFNSFLVADIFRIPWAGFGFPEFGSITEIVGWSAEGLARLLPNLAYWIVYAFYLVFLFFYAVLGPFVLAKGILSDEMDTFFELVKELVNVFLWQTTLVVLVAFIMPDIVSGKPFPPQPQANFYFLSLILGVLILFVPTLTRKFALQIESAFVPMGFRWGGTMLGFAVVAKATGPIMTAAGASEKTTARLEDLRERVAKAEDFRHRFDQRRRIGELSSQKQDMEEQLEEDYDKEEKTRKELSTSFLGLSQQAQEEVEPPEAQPPEVPPGGEPK